jgi:DNA (cytosine-5)-methyltransferase 1
MVKTAKSDERTPLRALDLFCGGGGAGMGLRLAGFDVVGVDCAWQLCYPFQQLWTNALTVSLEGFDFVWASPPCQAHTSLRRFPGVRDIEYPDLIPPVRDRLIASGLPFVIENVPGALRVVRLFHIPPS